MWDLQSQYWTLSRGKVEARWPIKVGMRKKSVLNQLIIIIEIEIH